MDNLVIKNFVKEFFENVDHCSTVIPKNDPDENVPNQMSPKLCDLLVLEDDKYKKRNVTDENDYKQSTNSFELWKSMSVFEQEIDSELSLLRLITWLKSQIQTLQNISLNSIQKNFHGISMLVCSQSNNHGLKNISKGKKSECKQRKHGKRKRKIYSLQVQRVTRSRPNIILTIKSYEDNREKVKKLKVSNREEVEFDSALGETNNDTIVHDPLEDSETISKESHLPLTDVPSSQISNFVFEEDDESNDHFRGWEETDDSAINMHESMANNIDPLEIPGTSVSKTLITNETFNQQDQPIENTESECTKVVSPEHMKYILSKVGADDFSLKIICSVVKKMSSHELTINPKQNIIVYQMAVNVITDFIKIYEEKIPAPITDFFMKPIVELIEKVFDLSAFKNLKPTSRHMYINTILEFCNCKQICRRTIEYLIYKLQNLKEDEDDAVDREDFYNIVLYKREIRILLYGLRITSKKFGKIMSRSTTAGMSEIYYKDYKRKWIYNLQELMYLDHFFEYCGWFFEIINILQAE